MQLIVVLFLSACAVLGIGAGMVEVLRDVVQRRRLRREQEEIDMLERMVDQGGRPR